jgi:sirohydrochlorin ferrochelatase
LKPGKLKYEFYPVTTKATILPSKLMEAHPLLADVTQARLLEISQDPANEIGIYVTHGEFSASGRRYHDGAADEMLGIIRERGIFHDVRRASINPKDETLPLARELLETTGKTLLFTHGFTERSAFTEDYIPHQLSQLPEGSYRWNSTPLLPHPAIRQYVLFRVAETLLANDRADLLFDEAREVWERYRGFEAKVSLPMLIPAGA